VPLKLARNIWLAVVLLAIPCQAQFQRMGIAPGFLSLAPRSSTSVRTFCLDFTREAPRSGVSYTSVLSNPEQMTVTVDGVRMNGQQAIDSKIIAWQGITPTFGDVIRSLDDPAVLSRLSAGDRQQATRMRALWQQLNPSERREVEASFQGLLGDAGDHTKLNLVNLTDRKVDISIGSKAVLGTEPESLAGLKVGGVSEADNDLSQQQSQSEIWRASNRESQELLQTQGFYAGQADGLVGPQTKESIRKFQTAYGLPVTGVLDAKTNEKLRSAATGKNLDRINGSSPGTLVVAITNSPGDAAGRYKAYAGSAQTLYAGNDPAQLSAALNTELQRPGVDTLYLDLEGFSSDKAEALASSLRLRNPAMAVRSLTTSEDGLPARDLLFSKGVKVETPAIHVDEITAGERKGWFAATIDFSVRVGAAVKRVSLRIVASTRELATEFANALFSRATALRFDENAAIAEMVRGARLELRSKHPELKDEDIRVEMKDQFGATLIVQVLPLPLDALAA
jgi:hypothetical protein